MPELIIDPGYTKFSTAISPVQSLPILLRACTCHSSDRKDQIFSHLLICKDCIVELSILKSIFINILNEVNQL